MPRSVSSHQSLSTAASADELFDQAARMRPSCVSAVTLGAVLFIALMITFSTLGQTTPSSPMLLLIGALGVTSHLVLLPVVSCTGTASFTRACGYAWIMIDVMLIIRP